MLRRKHRRANLIHKRRRVKKSLLVNGSNLAARNHLENRSLLASHNHLINQKMTNVPAKRQLNRVHHVVRIRSLSPRGIRISLNNPDNPNRENPNQRDRSRVNRSQADHSQVDHSQVDHSLENLNHSTQAVYRLLSVTRIQRQFRMPWHRNYLRMP